MRYLTYILLFICFSSKGQDTICATIGEAEFLQEFRGAFHNAEALYTQAVVINHYTIDTVTGFEQYALTESEIEEGFLHLNEMHPNIFVNDLGYVNADDPRLFDAEYYEFRNDPTGWQYWEEPYDECVVVIHVVNSIRVGGSQAAGAAVFPNDQYRRMIVARNYFLQSTLEHEFGHIFGLIHTFGDNKELVNGDNCSTNGDKICDTPADRSNLTAGYSSCKLNPSSSNKLDFNGDTLRPDTDLFMSYYPKNCRVRFSEEQVQRMIDVNMAYCSDIPVGIIAHDKSKRVLIPIREVNGITLNKVLE